MFEFFERYAKILHPYFLPFKENMFFLIFASDPLRIIHYILAEECIKWMLIGTYEKRKGHKILATLPWLNSVWSKRSSS